MTRTHDADGVPYAKLSGLKVGSVVRVDDGFECIPNGEKKVVLFSDPQTLAIRCSDGLHCLDGQLQEDGDTLIGIYATSTL